MNGPRLGFEPHLTDRQHIWLNWAIDLVNIEASLFCYYDHIMSDFQRLQLERVNSDHYWFHMEALALWDGAASSMTIAGPARMRMSLS